MRAEVKGVARQRGWSSHLYRAKIVCLTSWSWLENRKMKITPSFKMAFLAKIGLFRPILAQKTPIFDLKIENSHINNQVKKF